ncbi:senescence-associated carboxylesterase [Quillaja saponaria]|uniref:Senescence-associated carboxylesterase n=1 Tax=Quillaja saponaria TaxID=32244 RepID=A0AAD7VG76_QUISA|nr:senescence-associated carboxylesterase [Quillaja saponaria]
MGCACFENPESILEVLVAMGSIGNPNEELETVYYGNIVEHLSRKAICEDITALHQDVTDSFHASIILQLLAIGSVQLQHQKDLAKKIEKQEKKFIIQKRKVIDPFKKLNDIKYTCPTLDANEVEKKKLIDFEDYVMESLKNYPVSPEIFLEHSSFRQWWKEYKAIKGYSYNSTLAGFINNRKSKKYATGDLQFD